MRLADVILSGNLRMPDGTFDPEVKSVLCNSIADATVIDATNVYEYCRLKEEVMLYDLPCGAPPQDNVFVEYMQRNGQRIGVHGVASTGPFSIAGLRPEGTTGPNEYRKLVSDDNPRFPPRWVSANLPDQAAWTKVRWIWWCELYQQMKGTPYGPLGYIEAALDDNGRLLDVTWGLHIVVPSDRLDQLTVYPFMVFLTTMNFMQCANIRTVYIDPPAALSRKHRRKGHLAPDRDLVRYHILKLAPLGPAQRSRGRSTDGTKGLIAFHPVAGGFHHYGDCCPGYHLPKGKLFGKHTGRYWIPDHVRGNPERGKVDHGYEILPVPEDASITAP